MASRATSFDEWQDGEGRHRQSGPQWSERHRLLVLGDGGEPAMAMAVGIEATLRHRAASFQCVVFEDGGPPVVIAEDGIPVPDERWELRTSGLWTDNICESPYRHWGYGLEAFALEIDDPAELLGRGYGRRVPLGWELEFEGAPDEVARWPVVDGGAYGQPGRVDGLLLFAGRSRPLTGDAVRQHWWGPNAAVPIELLDLQAGLGTAPTDAGPGGGDHRDAGTAGEPVGLPLASGVWWLSWLDGGDGGLSSRTEPSPDGPGPQR